MALQVASPSELSLSNGGSESRSGTIRRLQEMLLHHAETADQLRQKVRLLEQEITSLRESATYSKRERDQLRVLEEEHGMLRSRVEQLTHELEEARRSAREEGERARTAESRLALLAGRPDIPEHVARQWRSALTDGESALREVLHSLRSLAGAAALDGGEDSHGPLDAHSPASSRSSPPSPHPSPSPSPSSLLDPTQVRHLASQCQAAASLATTRVHAVLQDRRRLRSDAGAQERSAEQLRSQLESLRSQLRSEQAARQSAESEARRVEAGAHEATRWREEVLRLESAHREAQAAARRWQQDATEARREAQRLQGEDGRRQEALDAAETELGALRSQLARAEDARETAETRAQTLAQEIASLRAREADQLGQVDRLRRELRGAEGHAGEMEQRTLRAESAAEMATKRCEAMLEARGELERSLAEERSRAQELLRVLEERSSQCEELREELEAAVLAAVRAQNARASGDLSRTRDIARSTAERLQELESRTEELRRKLEATEDAKRRMWEEAQETIRARDAELRAERATIERLEAQLAVYQGVDVYAVSFGRAVQQLQRKREEEE